MKTSSLGLGDERICIAILDGPIDFSHTCFHGAKLTQLPTIASQEFSSDQALEHGTNIASIIFGQPGTEVPGVAPYCRGLIVPIFSADSMGNSLRCSQLDLARAILLSVENGAHIINISGGQLAPSGEPEPLLDQAIKSCAQHNVLIVAAAGNDGCECVHVPAASDSVLAVGAMDAHGNPYLSSNWGEAYRANGILAPGVDVLVAAPGGGTAHKSGTSFAAPFVSGVVGLIASLKVNRGESPDTHTIRAVLLTSADPCISDTSEDCRRILGGRINIPRLVQQITKKDNNMNNNSVDEILTSESYEPWQEGHTSLSNANVQTTSSICAPVPGNRINSPQGIGPSAVGLGNVTPSDCGCGGGANCNCNANSTQQKPALVYALGRLGYDLGSEARRDSFIQTMEAIDKNACNPNLPKDLLGFFNIHPYEASSVIWTLNLDATPIYAIVPAGPFATNGYDRLREFLDSQVNEGAELVSIPGVIGGSIKLQSGQTVPVVVPVLRGMYCWCSEHLVKHLLGPAPLVDSLFDPDVADAKATKLHNKQVADFELYEKQATGLTDFLNRVYYDMRNLGITAEDRALNFAATNAFQVAKVIHTTVVEELDLDTLAVKKSPICRPDSDCYDVELSFFNPTNTNVANRVFRYTVDVSDVVPVTIGEMRSWRCR